MSLNKLYDFIQVAYSMRRHYTKVEYFLSISYLLPFIYYWTKNQIIIIIMCRK
jgi:hypothetical protein